MPTPVNEVVFICKVVAINPEGNVTLEIKALHLAPIIAVVGLGGSFQYHANIVETPITDVSAARAALERARRA